MNSSCAIVVCDNGLGHLRRCIIIANRLRERYRHIHLYAPEHRYQKICRVFPWATGLNIILHDFSTQTSEACFRRGLGDALAWLDALPDLDSYDIVISDNLPEILSRRSDAIISAQFFWHDIYRSTTMEYGSYCEQLLSYYKPLVISCGMFAMPAVRLQARFTPVGLYKNPELVTAFRNTSPLVRTDLLVTGGTTSAARVKLLHVIDELLNSGPDCYKHVFVDPNLLPSEPPEWMIEADFSVSMYCRVKSAICRPGLGVLTDLITVGATITPVYEEANSEMVFNANCILEIMSQRFL